MPEKERAKDFERLITLDGTLKKVSEHQTYSKFRNGHTYTEPVEFDCLSHITSLEKCDDILKNGINLDRSDEMLTICNDLKLSVDGMLELRPSKLSDKKKGVIFTFSELKFLALRRFYLLEILGDGQVSVLRIFVTHNTHTGLKKFNPFLETKSPSKSGTLPIVFFKGKWYQYRNLMSNNGKKSKLFIHFLLDNVPQQSAITCNYLPFDSGNLVDAFFFFTKLSKYKGSQSIKYEGDTSLLRKIIQVISQCRYNSYEVVNTYPFIEKIEDVNKALFSIDFAKAFDTGQIQDRDKKYVNAMDLIFLKAQQVPNPQTILNVIAIGINGMETKEKQFSDIFAIFLKHFLSQEAKLTVQGNVIAHLYGL